MPRLLTSTEPEKIVFQGKIVEVVNQKMVGGKKDITFEWARRSPGTRVLIVDMANKTIRLTREHRYEKDGDDYRLPGGKVFDTLVEYNEFLDSGGSMLVPAQAKAIAEAGEEAGVDIQNLQYLATSTNGTTMKWDLFYFVSSKWNVCEQSLEDGETSMPMDVTFAEAAAMALDGRMAEDRSVSVLLRWLYSHGLINIKV